MRKLWDFLQGYKLHILGPSLLMLASLRFQPRWMSRGDSDVISKSSSTLISSSSNTTEESEDIVVAGAVFVTSKTDPPFATWLFPPNEDIISRKISAAGVYEPEETLFVRQVVETSKRNGGAGWAMDIGTNIGFHSLHMAALGMNVISLEPSPDTASLLRRSVQANGFDHQPSSCNNRSANRTCNGSVRIVQAAAAATPGVGRLLRHPESAGMTILQRHGDSSDSDILPFGVENVIQDDIELVRAGDILSKTIGASPKEDELWLLKVDAEGYELHALKGADLAKFPFQYLTFEFFPELLIKAGKTDPLDLLLYIHSFGYACGMDPASVQEDVRNSTLMRLASDIEEWYNRTAVPAHRKTPAYHINMFCAKKNEMHRN